MMVIVMEKALSWELAVNDFMYTITMNNECHDILCLLQVSLHQEGPKTV